jgi:hypothetical protein
MILSVYIPHWLDENGHPAPTLRRRVLRIARLIEYGGPLEAGQLRETLVECSRRPMRQPCEGLLWVTKSKDRKTIEAFCQLCKDEQIYITGWELTDWAEGPMEPVSLEDMPKVN